MSESPSKRESKARNLTELSQVKTSQIAGQR